MKCPFCNAELRTNMLDQPVIWYCPNHCIGSYEPKVWQALIDGKKAQDAIQEIKDIVYPALDKEFYSELRDDMLAIGRIIVSVENRSNEICKNNGIKGQTMKQITIYELLPLLRPGWVAMEKNGIWYWYAHKPVPDNIGIWIQLSDGDLYELGAFNIATFDGDWKDSLMECGKQDVHDKVTLKTAIGDIVTTPVAPKDVCIAPKIEEFSFTIELINGAKISFEGIPNNAGLTDEQMTTFFEDLFSVKEIKK